MNIRISSISGFCMGVEKAVEAALEAEGSDRGTVYVDGPVIHNPQVIEQLASKGIKTLNNSDQLSMQDTLIIRAHGIPPEREREFKRTGCRLINCTCPLVKRIQMIIAEEVQNGRTIIILGEKGHPEVTSLQGYTENKAILVESTKDLNSVPADIPLSFVAQSTQNVEVFSTISEELQQHNPDTTIHDTICRETRKRQEAVRDLARSCDAVIIVGGKESGNTRRLAQIASETVPVFYIETEKDIEIESLRSYETVGIAGGASTPDWMIKRVANKLKKTAD